MEGKILKGVRMRREFINKVDELAKKENRSFSNMMETIIDKYFEVLQNTHVVEVKNNINIKKHDK